MSATIKASKKGDFEALKALLAEDRSRVNDRDTDGSTPLHCAAWKGYPELVKLLLESGADVNARSQNDHWGTTPLHAAAHANRGALVRLLIEHGADIHAKDLSGQSPLDHTAFHNASAAAKVLREFLEKL